MKKIFITAAIATLFSASVFADGVKKATVNISYAVKNQFNADFAEAQNVNWSVSQNLQRVDFTVNDVKMTSFYNMQGQFVGLTQDLDYAVIPVKAKKLIAEKYKGYNVSEVIVLQSNPEVKDVDDEVAYFVDLKNDDHEALVRITHNADIELFKQVK